MKLLRITLGRAMLEDLWWSRRNQANGSWRESCRSNQHVEKPVIRVFTREPHSIWIGSTNKSPATRLMTLVINKKEKVPHRNLLVNQPEINIKRILHSFGLWFVECGLPSVSTSNRKKRLVGGDPAEEGKWPWQAALLDKFGTQFCGGVLITNKHVLTSATCASRYKNLKF